MLTNGCYLWEWFGLEGTGVEPERAQCSDLMLEVDSNKLKPPQCWHVLIVAPSLGDPHHWLESRLLGSCTLLFALDSCVK